MVAQSDDFENKAGRILFLLCFRVRMTKIFLTEEKIMSEKSVAEIIKSHSCICYYPSCGTDISDLDFFCSGGKLWQERINGPCNKRDNSFDVIEPDLFIHTDVNLYNEFDGEIEELAQNSGFHGRMEVVSFQQLEGFDTPNVINPNMPSSGACFKYELRLWGSNQIKTLLFCVCENEYFVSKILLANSLSVPYIWCKNWNGGRTVGTWLVNVMDVLGTKKFYSDWLCIPGKRGEPSNEKARSAYPQLFQHPVVELEKNEAKRWIDEGFHGWVEEYRVKRLKL